MDKKGFYQGKRVLVTGCTGFKGTWLCKMLLREGAVITGYALNPPTSPSLFTECSMDRQIRWTEGDIRDYTLLNKTFQEAKPEIVFHLAAQPIVRESYINPRETYEINVMGTVNVLECIRLHDCVKSFVNITTDKVYRNKEWVWGYRENEELDGYDPYSNSKSCSELVTHSYWNSYFAGMPDGTGVSTARAGNVLGGGDFAADRIIPDCYRAVSENRRIRIRNPYSVRPYQHVLEALHAYMLLAQRQYEDPGAAGWYNIGPEEKECISTGELTELFCRFWEIRTGNQIAWENIGNHGPHEATFLKLDCSKIKSAFNWRPIWDINQTMDKVVEWYESYLNGKDFTALMDCQIDDFYREYEELRKQKKTDY